MLKHVDGLTQAMQLFLKLLQSHANRWRLNRSVLLRHGAQHLVLPANLAVLAMSHVSACIHRVNPFLEMLGKN